MRLQQCVRFARYARSLSIIYGQTRLHYPARLRKRVITTTQREETYAGTKANDSFGKGFHVLKDHVLNRLMTGRWPSKSLQLRPKFHSLFLQNGFDFQKSANT